LCERYTGKNHEPTTTRVYGGGGYSADPETAAQEPAGGRPVASAHHRRHSSDLNHRRRKLPVSLFEFVTSDPGLYGIGTANNKHDTKAVIDRAGDALKVSDNIDRNF
jgi:hypothetical protein